MRRVHSLPRFLSTSMVSRAWGRVWVGFTVCLISFIAYSSQIFVIWPWYGSTLSVELLKLLLPFKYVCCCRMLRNSPAHKYIALSLRSSSTITIFA